MRESVASQQEADTGPGEASTVQDRADWGDNTDGFPRKEQPDDGHSRANRPQNHRPQRQLAAIPGEVGPTAQDVELSQVEVLSWELQMSPLEPARPPHLLSNVHVLPAKPLGFVRACPLQ